MKSLQKCELCASTTSVKAYLSLMAECIALHGSNIVNGGTTFTDDPDNAELKGIPVRDTSFLLLMRTTMIISLQQIVIVNSFCTISLPDAMPDQHTFQIKLACERFTTSNVDRRNSVVTHTTARN